MYPNAVLRMVQGCKRALGDIFSVLPSVRSSTCFPEVFYYWTCLHGVLVEENKLTTAHSLVFGGAV